MKLDFVRIKSPATGVSQRESNAIIAAEPEDSACSPVYVVILAEAAKRL